MKKKYSKKTEKEILDSIVDKAMSRKQTEWLPADFGERAKQLRLVHHYNQQEVAYKLHTSVSTISRLENGMISAVDIELICNMADLYNVSTDFLLGQIRNPERMYYTLKDLGLTPEAGLALYSGRADKTAVSAMLENKKFQDLTHSVRDYILRQTDDRGIPITFLIEGKMAPETGQQKDYLAECRYARTFSYMDKMHSACANAALDNISNEMKNLLPEIRRDQESYMQTAIKLTSEMLQMMKKAYRNKYETSDDPELPEQLAERILHLFSPNGQLSDIQRSFLLSFRNALMSLKLDDEGGDESAR